MSFSRLVRFVPKSNPDRIFIGEPVNSEQDVGLATRKGERVEVRLFHGKSALDPGTLSDQVETIGKLLSPLSQQEVGTIRCIGLNVRNVYREALVLGAKRYKYKQHAAEVKMPLPTEPTLFL